MTMRYRGVLYAKDGYLFAGVAKRLPSSWFKTQQEAEDWLYAMADGQEHKIAHLEIQREHEES